MTGQVHAFARPGSTNRPPLVPGNIDVSDADIMASSVRYQQWRSARMSAEHFGVWSRLQIASHLEKITGTLPDDDIDLAIAAGFTAEGVDRWLAMKGKVLEDWLLCSDGRWHHPMRARNVLHIWIGGRERDRRSALGNKGKSAKARAMVADLEDAIEFGRDTLFRIDPQDRFLAGLDERISKWPSKADLVVGEASGQDYDSDGDRERRNTTATVTVDPRTTPLHGDRKRNEVKCTESISPDLRSGASGHDEFDGLEIERSKGSAKRTPLGPAPPWPTDAREQLRAVYPKWKNPGDVDKALTTLRKANKTPFPDILAGAERVRDTVRDGTKELQFVAHPARWLRARGWEDDPDPPAAGPPSYHGRATAGRPSAIAGIRRRLRGPDSQPGEAP